MSKTSQTPPSIQDPLLLNEPFSPLSPTPAKSYKTYRYRFLITTLYCLVSIVNAIMWICTSPITTNLEAIYGLDLFTVHFCTSMIWFVVYPPMNFAANYVLDGLGLRAGLFLGATLTVIGLWIRTFSSTSFYYIFAGQLLGAIGQPFLMNAPQKLSAVWYPPSERALSTTVASIANPIGVGIGFLMAQNFVADDAQGAEGRSQVHDLMFFTALAGTILVLPSYFLFKNKPVTPPSKTADTEKYSYKESLKHLLKNWNYLIFIVSTGLLWGGYNVIATALQPLVEPYGFSASNSGNLGAISLISGLVGSVIWGVYVDRTKKFKRSLICCAVMSIISLVGIILLAHTGNFVYLACITAFYGFFTTPIFPLSYELSAELSFPVAEAASGGLMVVMTQIFGALGTVGIDSFLEAETKGDSDVCFMIVGGIAVVGLIGYVLTKEELKRSRAEDVGTSGSVAAGSTLESLS